MRIATSGQMAAIDRETISGGVPGLELMERAGQEMVYVILEHFPEVVPPNLVAICCGRGNNGGDGLVVARLLSGFGFEVTVMMLCRRDDLSRDAAKNFVKLPSDVRVVQVEDGQWVETWLDLSAEAELLIDAIFGTGIKPPLRGEYIELCQAFDVADAPVVSLDIPSGVDGDNGCVDPEAVCADLTITVGLPKLGLLLPPGRDNTGNMVVVDIGFPGDICEKHTDELYYLTEMDYAALLPARSSETHKYSAGTTLVLAGSREFGGAGLLAGLGALRSGSGLVTLALPAEHVPAATVFLPEAVIRPLTTGSSGGLCPLGDDVEAWLLTKQNALAVGPGMGADPETDAFLVSWLGNLPLPMVVDADALNAFARNGSPLRFKSPVTILTPHVAEMARLTDLGVSEIRNDPIGVARKYAERWNAVVVLKGSPTVVAHPAGPVVVNPTGNDALAHGGTGDVLTGLIGGLLSQGLDAFKAAILGCWLHGRAGDYAGLEGSRRCVLAREVADALPLAFADLETEWSPE